MKEEKSKNIIIGLMGVIIVILGSLVVLFATDKINFNNSDELDQNNDNSSSNVDDDENKFETFLNDVSGSLGFLVIISTFNENQVDKNFNLLGYNSPRLASKIKRDIIRLI